MGFYGRIVTISCAWLVSLFLLTSAQAEESDIKVMIAEGIPFVDVDHQGVKVRIKRIQDTENRLVDDFSKTSRPCPPFCIHPIEAAPGVHTVGELELIKFLLTNVASETGLLIDARMPNWYESETIPGSVNIPFVIFTTPSAKRDSIMQLLGGTKTSAEKYTFKNPKHLTLFCNGPWCDQSPRAIQGLIHAGYPANKLSYYRGGMQLWKSFGLTTVLPKSREVK